MNVQTQSIPVDALGGGTGGPLPAPTPWTNFGSFTGYPYGGVIIGNPTGGNEGIGTLNVQNGLFINGQPLSSLFQPFGVGSVTVGSSPPTSPAPQQGSLWWDSVGGQLYMYYEDGTSNQWVVTNSFTGLTDAPSTGVLYGRYNGQWSNVIDAGTF